MSYYIGSVGEVKKIGAWLCVDFRYSFNDVIIAGEVLQHFALTRYLRLLSRTGFTVTQLL